MEYPVLAEIETALDEGVLTVRIARPHKRNTITPDQVHHICETCRLADRDDAVRVVVITGTEDSFCAGADLSNVDLSASGGQVPPISMNGNEFLKLWELSKPLIAGVNGITAGAGMGMALCSDIRVASTKARFAASFARIGITANDAVAYLLPRLVGSAHALEMIYLGMPIDADEAARIGLVTHVYPHEEIDERVQALARKIAAGPPVAIQLSKRMVIDGMQRTYREHVLAQEYSSLANRMLADGDIKEGMAAFLEKRPARFTGFVGERRWANY